MSQFSDQVLELNKLIDYTDTSSLHKQLTLVEKISSEGESGLKILLSLLQQRKLNNNWAGNCVDGLIYEILYKSTNQDIQKLLKQNFPHGIIDLSSENNVTYTDLQLLLTQHGFHEADKLTQKKLCELASIDEQKRNWLYFTDIKKLPQNDLHIIDSLWKAHSRGKFGFSVQRQIWLKNDKDWSELWNKLGWQKNNILCRYPQDFIWNLSGPKGHLPLFNQLRGVQSLSSLFHHPVWNNYS